MQAPAGKVRAVGDERGRLEEQPVGRDAGLEPAGAGTEVVGGKGW